MARINIEDKWWSDPRRDALIMKIGIAADSVALRAWRLSQEYWSKGNRHPIPKTRFMILPHATELIEVGLAEVVNDEFVYVKGTVEHHEWCNKRSESGAEGGRRRHGNHSGKNLANSSKPKQTLASSSSSSSKERNTYAQQAARVYENFYPKKRGKTRGLKRLQLTSEQDLADFELAVKRYADVVRGKDPQFTMHFSTFVGEWRDWLPSSSSPSPDSSAPPPSLDELLYVPPIGDES